MQILNKNKIFIHCCTQKTASQWFIYFLSEVFDKSNKHCDKYIFSSYRESVIFKVSKYRSPSYLLQRDLYTNQNAEFGFNNLKTNSLYTSFYVGPTILRFLKSKKAKVFFILRDPRDLVISWYYSSKYSHPPTDDINRVRSVLVNNSFEDGIKYSIDQMSEFGLFDCVKGWIQQKENNRLFRVYLYEDFVEQYATFCLNLLSFLDLNKRKISFEEIIDKHSYENYSSGRNKGEADNKSHYRSAGVNQWKDEFNEELLEYFEYKTNNLGKLYDRRKNDFKIQ